MSNPNEDTQEFDVAMWEPLKPTCEGYGPPTPTDCDQDQEGQEN